MTEIYSGWGKKKYSRSQIRKMIKKMKKSYAYVPYYKKRADKEQKKQSLDADKMLERGRDDENI